jgi:hypothetical protein
MRAGTFLPASSPSGDEFTHPSSFLRSSGKHKGLRLTALHAHHLIGTYSLWLAAAANYCYVLLFPSCCKNDFTGTSPPPCAVSEFTRSAVSFAPRVFRPSNLCEWATLGDKMSLKIQRNLAHYSAQKLTHPSADMYTVYGRSAPKPSPRAHGAQWSERERTQSSSSCTSALGRV